MRNDILLKCSWANLRLGRGRQSDKPFGIAVLDFIGICLVFFVLGGCVNLGRSYPEKHSYILEAVRSGETHASMPGTVLKVRKFRVTPTFEGKTLVYRTSDARYEGDFYNEWFVPPNAMLTQQVVNWLTTAGLFQYVMDSSGPLPATHMLEGTLKVMYGDYRASVQRLFWPFNSSSFMRHPLRQRCCGIRSIGKKWTSWNGRPRRSCRAGMKLFDAS